MSSTKLLGNKGKTQNTCHKNLRHTYTCKAFMQLFIQRDSTLTLTHTFSKLVVTPAQSSAAAVH